MNRSIGLSRSAHRFARNHQRPQFDRRRRRLSVESLERRVLLAVDSLAWHNADFPEDVNGDGSMSSIDALLVINDLNVNGPRAVDDSVPAGMVDVTGEGFVSSADALRIINALNKAEGEQHEQVRIRLAVTSVGSMDPTSTLGPNEDFFLRAFVQDLTGRPGNSGVFGAYLDVTYSTTLSDITGAIEFSDIYTTARSGSTNTAGLIDEVGASDGLAPLGLDEQLLFSVPMRTKATLGTATFSGDPADSFPAHDTLLFGLDDPIPTSDIEYSETSVQIIFGNPPVAIDNDYFGIEDQTLIVDVFTGVLINDNDADGDNLTAKQLSGPEHGTLTLNPDGTFIYVPEENFFGEDSFTYAANDGTFDSDPATVTLTIDPVNDAPVVQDESYEVGVNTLLSVLADAGVLANDVDIEGSPITAELTVTTSNGALNFFADGSFSYAPNQDFSGTDFLEYVVSDGDRSSVTARATIVVTENAAPVAMADNYATLPPPPRRSR